MDPFTFSDKHRHLEIARGTCQFFLCCALVDFLDSQTNILVLRWLEYLSDSNFTGEISCLTNVNQDGVQDYSLILCRV